MIVAKGAENYLNINKERNAENTENEEYNCGGYAMGTLTWISISAFSNRDEYNGDDGITEINIWDFSDEVLRKCQEELVDYFAGLIRPINNISELKEDEYAVLFRLSVDEDYDYIQDYHFVKCNHNGTYTHKPGSTAIRDFEEDPFEEDWVGVGYVYNSNIRIFAVNNLLY